MSTNGGATDSIAMLAKTAAEVRAETPGVDASTHLGLALVPILRVKDAYVRSILADESFGRLRGGWVSFAGAGHALDPHALPNILLGRVLKGEQAESVATEARAFAEHGSSAGIWYGALAGATINETCPLADGMDLIPWDAVPLSTQKETLDSKRGRAFATPLRATPNCAVRIALPKRRALFATAMDDESASSLSERLLFRAHARADDVIRLMTVVSERPVALLAGWPQPTEGFLTDILGTSMQFGPGLHEPGVFGHSLDPMRLDAAALAAAFSRFDAFTGGDRAALSTAIDRIGAALRWKAPTESTSGSRLRFFCCMT